MVVNPFNNTTFCITSFFLAVAAIIIGLECGKPAESRPVDITVAEMFAAHEKHRLHTERMAMLSAAIEDKKHARRYKQLRAEPSSTSRE